MYAFFSAVEKVALRMSVKSYNRRTAICVPFLADSYIRRVALLVLSRLLNSLIQLLVDRSASSHQILLDTAQSGEHVVNKVERPLLELPFILGWNSTSKS